MDGLFQLLIVAFFIVSAIFDAVSRNRKKQEQKERMEAEEAAEEGQVAGATPRTPRPPRPRPAEGRTGRTKAPTGEGGSRAGAGGRSASSSDRSGDQGGDRSGQRETADTMIPEDFWAILTGQAPNPRTLPRTGEPDPPERAQVPVPVPSDRMAGEGATASSEDVAPTRRSSRWMEGLDEGDSEAEAPVLAGTRPRPRPGAPVPGGSRSFPAAPPRPDSPFARPTPPQRGRATADPMDEPWGELEDISKGEIGDGRGATQGAVDLYGGQGRRAGASDSPYVRLVASGRQDDLKAAIVLREVLGAPVGSRGPNEGPGGWRWDDR